MFRKVSLIVASIFTLASVARAQDHTHHHMADHASVHGMLIFGEKTTFLSHLPMFHPPHDYQGIFEAEFDANAVKAYLSAKAASSETVYTLVPESFVLPEMVANPRPFKATIYKGHFERGGTPIATTMVTFKKVLYFQKFDPSAQKPQEEKYLSIVSLD